MHAFEQLINLLAPHRCISCLAEGPVLCDSCSTSVIPPPQCCFKCGKPAAGFICMACRPTTTVDQLSIASAYKGPAKMLVYQLKFARVRAASQPIAQLMAPHIPADACLVPIPTAAPRVRQRGYDQAVLIARHIARLTGLPFCPLLARHTKTRQLGQSRAVRQTQLQDAFALRTPLPQTTRQLLLIDDVITTGATVEAAASLLKQAGARQVSAALFAVA
jgi:ComF family protein